MKWLQIPLVLTFAFFLFVGMAQEGAGEGAGARARGRAVLADGLNRFLVEPLTMPGALLLVFCATAALCFVMSRLGPAVDEH